MCNKNGATTSWSAESTGEHQIGDPKRRGVSSRKHKQTDRFPPASETTRDHPKVHSVNDFRPILAPLSSTSFSCPESLIDHGPAHFRKQHFLYFFPLPQGHRTLRGIRWHSTVLLRRLRIRIAVKHHARGDVLTGSATLGVSLLQFLSGVLRLASHPAQVT